MPLSFPGRWVPSHHLSGPHETLPALQGLPLDTSPAPRSRAPSCSHDMSGALLSQPLLHPAPVAWLPSPLHLTVRFLTDWSLLPQDPAWGPALSLTWL